MLPSSSPAPKATRWVSRAAPRPATAPCSTSATAAGWSTPAASASPATATRAPPGWSWTPRRRPPVSTASSTRSSAPRGRSPPPGCRAASPTGSTSANDWNCRQNLLLRAFSRLATMRQLAVPFIALALGVATAFALASCGGEDAKLLPGATAAEISENLDTVKQLASEGECVGAADAAEEVSAQVEALGGLDPELKQALERGAARLSEVVATCEETTTEAFEPSTEDTEETAPKIPPGQEKKEEK